MLAQKRLNSISHPASAPVYDKESLRICISDQVSGDAAAAGQGALLLLQLTDLFCVPRIQHAGSHLRAFAPAASSAWKAHTFEELLKCWSLMRPSLTSKSKIASLFPHNAPCFIFFPHLSFTHLTCCILYFLIVLISPSVSLLEHKHPKHRNCLYLIGMFPVISLAL